MTYLASILALLAAAAPAEGQPDPIQWLPSALLPVTAPDYVAQPLSEDAAALCRVRYSSPHENDLAVLRGGDLGLLVRPGRLQCFYSLRSGVAAMAPVSLPGSNLESMLVASASGLECLGYDPGVLALHSAATDETVSGDARWGQTRGIWVHDEGGGSFAVYGAVGEDLLAARYDPGSGWQDLGTSPLNAELQELAWFDFNGDGRDEMVWRLSTALLIQDTTSGQLLVNLRAGPSDRIAALSESDAHDRLAWSTTGPGGTDVLTLFELSTRWPWVAIESGRPSALLPIGYTDGVGGAPNGQEVAAVSSTSGRAWLQASPNHSGFAAPVPNPDGAPGGDTADLRDDPLGNDLGVGAVAAASGDFDGDGRDDLAFMRASGELLFWFGHPDRSSHSYTCIDSTNPFPTRSSGSLRLPLAMRRGDAVPAGSESHVRVLFRAGGSSGAGTLVWAGDVVEAPDPNGVAGLGDVILPLDMGAASFHPGDYIRVSVTPRVNAGGDLERYGVTRNLFWVPGAPAGTGWPEVDAEPVFAHTYAPLIERPGDGTGTRTGGGQNLPPTTPPPGGG